MSGSAKSSGQINHENIRGTSLPDVAGEEEDNEDDEEEEEDGGDGEAPS